MGYADIPAAPIRGFTLPPLITFINFPNKTPHTVSRQIAKNPKANMIRVWGFKKTLPSMVAPMEIPSRRVTMLAISFSEAFVRRLTAPLSFIRFPSMIVPSNGNPFGAIRPPITVTTKGKRILVVFETELLTAPMLITLSSLEVKSFMIGGWITGTKDMYEYAATDTAPKRWGAYFDVT